MSARLTRRQFVRIAGCCAVGLGALDALAVEPSWLEVTEHDLPVPGLPHSLQGFRIAHLSDVHLRAIGRVHESIFAAVRAMEPNLIVLTGDCIEDENHLELLQELCAQLAAKGRDVIATLGNWEHWGQISMRKLHDTYARAGVTLLVNKSTALANGIVLLATDDACSGYADLASTLSDVPTGAARLFLTHAPGLFDELPAAMPSFDLGLAGHTHGGQVRALGAAVWVPPGSGRFRAGMYTTPKGKVYVSRGIGTSILPVRFTCRPELPIFRLVAG